MIDGALLSYMRSQEGRIYESRSRDLGRTWTVPRPTSLPNNNSGIDMVHMRSGLLALVYNPVGLPDAIPALDKRWPARMPVGFDRWGKRTPLVVVFSLDEGKTWPRSITLEEGPGEYSYPAIIQGQDGSLHITYTYRRIAIRHVKIEEREVEKICRTL
jgi:predicted neuraminidase